MRALFHLFCFSLYAGLAGAIVGLAPTKLPWLTAALPPGWLPALAVATLLGGALIHEAAVRLAGDAAHDRDLDSLDNTQELQNEELARLQGEIESLRAALAAAPTTPGKAIPGNATPGNASPGHATATGRGVDDVMKEAKVLKSLMPRLEVPLPAMAPGAPQAAPDGRVEPTLLRPLAAPDRGGAAGGPPPVGSLPPVAEALPPAMVLDIVRNAQRDDRVDLVLQPIVSLPQRKRRFYECFSRLRTPTGEMILPEQYIALAEGAGLIQAIDNMLLFRCVQLVRKIHRRSDNIDFFCNISPHSIADADFFGDFVDFLESNEPLACHLVFEFAQADFARWSEAGAGLLDRLANLGCRFSLDQVDDLDLDVAGLARRHVRFLKIEAPRLMHEVADKPQLLRSLRRRHIDLIVEKVENESLLIELLDYDIDFGQGFLFGAPRLARPAA